MQERQLNGVCMLKLNKLSLRMKILTMVGSILATIALGAAYNINNFRNTFEKTEKVVFKDFADALSDSMAAQMYERYGDAQAFAANDAVISMKPELMTKYLDQYVSLYGIYDLIIVVNKKGQFVAASQKDAAGKVVNLEALRMMDFSKEPWFEATINGRTTDDKEKNFANTYIEGFIKDTMMEKAFGEARYGSSFTAPIRDESGAVIGVVSNRAGSRWIEAELVSSWANMNRFGYDTAEIMVLNENGIVIIDHNPKAYPGGKNEINHDPELVLKMDMSKHPALEALKHESFGFMYVENTKNKIMQAVGFSNMDSPKWPSSLNWTVLVRERAATVAAESDKAALSFIVIMGIIMFLSLCFAAWVGVLISKSIDQQIKILSENSTEVSHAAKSIANQSAELSESATEQAAALQETMAAVDQINAMVEKNSESAQRSKEVSNSSREAAERGRNTVENMLSSMNDINSANQQIQTQMDESNRQLSEITKLIHDIGSKTKVINEIVLQTKLLSFNASVEAARAGEAGKGFAVVAEEVGNLAQMSGNAAKEITELLEQSVMKVNSIVEETKHKVDRLMVDSQQKVSAGTSTAQECNSVLEEIISQVSSVDSLVSEIAVASKEQSQGIQEISKAVAQMEQVTNQNSTVAQSSNASAEQLNGQAQNLNSVVLELVGLVRGAGAQNIVMTADEPHSSSKVSKPKKATKTHASKSLESGQGKVLTMKPTPAPVMEPVETVAVAKASGGDFVPDANDPGFKE